MSVVAITGNICSGKTTVLHLLRAKGAKVINIDRAVHRHYRERNSEIYRRIKYNFPEVFDRHGRIIRRRLAQIVFGSKSKLRVLEKIVHPVVIEELREWVEKHKKKKGIFVAEVPLLFEKKLDRLFDAVVLVYASRRVLVRRIEKRFGLSRAEVQQRLKLFISDKKKKERVDFVLDNSGTLTELKREVVDLWERLKKG